MKKVVIVIGHRQGAQGAKNKNYNNGEGLSEYEYNSTLAKHIKSIAAGVLGLQIELIYRDDIQGGYIYLPASINEINPDYIISLHCNAYAELPGQKEVSGCETLYYYNSRRSNTMAEILQKHNNNFLKNPNRGIKPRRLKKEKPDGWEKIDWRGGHLLRYTDAPCVISEPIFMDTDEDLARAIADINAFAKVHLNAILEIVEKV